MVSLVAPLIFTDEVMLVNQCNVSIVFHRLFVKCKHNNNVNWQK